MTFQCNTPYAKRRAIMKWRWLPVVGLALVLSGCDPDMINQCSTPGVIGPLQCYHYLTVEKGQQSGEVKGKVARSVVEEDAKGMFNFYKPEEYPEFKYVFRVSAAEWAGLNDGQSYMFVSEANQPDLQLCKTDECKKAAEHFGQPGKH
jgi:hypothetical protein